MTTTSCKASCALRSLARGGKPLGEVMADLSSRLVPAILAELHALKLAVMRQLYTTEQSLQSVHHSQLETGLAYVDIKQRAARASPSPPKLATD